MTKAQPIKNKHDAVLMHLKKHKSITSQEAIDNYHATRLAAIIFDLRKHHEIDTVMVECTDMFGNRCDYGKYIYRGKRKDVL